jgi:lipoprotein-anchoring transpeptidase ErfK/SrfK
MYQAQIVAFPTAEAPGTIIVDTQNKFLYFTLKNQLAVRYGVGVGKEGFGWSGVVRVGAKQEWPSWTPPAEMIQRRPELVEYAGGMPGGPTNPLGARALYLFDGGRDTMFRIHGTNEPWSIGQNVSSGCIRMLNEHVTELYRMAKVGTKVIVL